jgi:hypothetical protein
MAGTQRPHILRVVLSKICVGWMGSQEQMGLPALLYREDILELLYHKEDSLEASCVKGASEALELASSQTIPKGTHDQSIARAFVLCLLDRLPKADSFYGFMVDSERLRWAPSNIENEPLKLFCLGAERLYRAIEDKVVKKAFLADFCRLFCSWCLPSCQRDRSTTLTIGPYSHALHVTRPFQQDSLCQHCLVREMPQGDSTVLICDVCEEFLSLRQQESENKLPPARASLLVKTKQAYEQRAGLVGKVILLQPTDPILFPIAADMKRFGYGIEHHGRPFELLVASYIPYGLCPSQDEEEVDPRKGVFHLLPLVNFPQLDFLVKKCKPRGFQSQLSVDVMDRWSKDGLLDLPGVVHMSYEEVSKMVVSTKLIVEAGAKEVSRQAQCLCRVPGAAPRILEGSPERTGRHREIDAEQADPYVCHRLDCSTLEYFNRGIVNFCRSTNERSHLLLDDFACARNQMFNEIRRRRGILGGVESDYDADDLAGEAMRYVKPASDNTQGEMDIQTPLFFAAGAESKDYTVVYSDLFFLSKAECQAFMNSNVSTVSSIPRHYPSTCTLTLLREQKANSPPELSGWGMELVQWNSNGEGATSVRRINPTGAAYASGLRSGDRIVALNELPTEKLESPISLACALLGAPFLANVSSSDRRLGASTLLKCVAGQAKCPLLAKIRREQPQLHPRAQQNKVVQSQSTLSSAG